MINWNKFIKDSNIKDPELITALKRSEVVTDDFIEITKKLVLKYSEKNQIEDYVFIGLKEGCLQLLATILSLEEEDKSESELDVVIYSFAQLLKSRTKELILKYGSR